MSFVQEESGSASCSLPRARPLSNYDVSVFPSGRRPAAQRHHGRSPPRGRSASSRASPADRAIFASPTSATVMTTTVSWRSTPLRRRDASPGALLRRADDQLSTSVRSAQWRGSRGHRPGLRHGARHLPRGASAAAGAFQKYTENAVSKTVELPRDATRDSHPECVRPRLPPRLQGRHRLSDKSATSRS